MNKHKNYIVIFIVIVIVLGFLYFLKLINYSESLVRKTIEQSIAGDINSLPISEEHKNILHSFFTNEMRFNNANSSIRLINKTNKTSDFLIDIEKIDYNENNEVYNIINGKLLIKIDRSSIQQCNIVSIVILKKFE